MFQIFVLCNIFLPSPTRVDTCFNPAPGTHVAIQRSERCSVIATCHLGTLPFGRLGFLVNDYWRVEFVSFATSDFCWFWCSIRISTLLYVNLHRPNASRIYADYYRQAYSFTYLAWRNHNSVFRCAGPTYLTFSVLAYSISIQLNKLLASMTIKRTPTGSGTHAASFQHVQRLFPAENLAAA
jgi:hypothetical protein